MKKLLRVVVLLVVLAAGGLAAVWYLAGKEGTTALEQWIGRQVLAILDAYITPTPHFDALDYQAPRTVVLDGVKLTLDDTSILEIDRMKLELAEIPRQGQPIRIQKIELDRPRMRFILTPDGEIMGWTNFIEPSVISDPDSVPSDRRLSDVLELRHIAFRDGHITYEEVASGTAMVLPGITLNLDTPPDADEPGWHRLVGELVRDPVFLLDFDGRINLDTIVLELARTELHVVLGEEQYSSLPPPLQTWLREHEVTGDLTITVSGTFPLTDPATGRGEVGLRLADGHFALGENHLPVDSFELDATLADGVTRLNYASRLLQGTLQGRGMVTLDEAMPAELSWDIRDIQIEETLRVVRDAPPKYAGKVTSAGQVRARLADLPASLGGGGELHLNEGRLVSLPLIAVLLRAAEALPVGQNLQHQDRARARFNFHGEFVQFDEIAITSGLGTMDGDGRVFYDQRLDLIFRAGLTERVRDRLGVVGDVLRGVSDQLVTYEVTGTLEEPRVRPRPLNIRRSR